MPLSKIQIDILGLLASQRDPESYVAGATPLNRNAPRYSADIDIFHDREERVASAAMKDAATLEGAGYQVKWLRPLPVVYAAEVTRHDGATRLECQSIAGTYLETGRPSPTVRARIPGGGIAEPSEYLRAP